MDPNNQNPQSPQVPPQPAPMQPAATPDISALIPPEQTQALFTELHLQNLPPEKKEEMLNTMIDTVMDRIFLRIEPGLSPESKQHLEELETKPGADQELVQYLVSVVPNLDQLAQEEINTYKGELKLQIDTIMQTLDQEAAKLPSDQPVTNPFAGVTAQVGPVAQQMLPQSPQPPIAVQNPPVLEQQPIVLQQPSVPTTMEPVTPQNIVTDSSQMSEALGAPTSNIPAPTNADIVQPSN